MKAKNFEVENAADFVAALVKYNIKLAPIIDKKEPIKWQAGFRKISNDGWTNVVGNTDFVTGKDPIDAVKRLLKGERDFVRRKGSLIKTVP